MPSYRGHLVGGAATYFLIYQSISLFSPLSFKAHDHLFFLGITLLGSLFPDIDVYSKMQQIFFKASLAILLVALIKQNMTIVIILGCLSTIVMAIQHRGITHKWWFLLLLSTAAFCFSVAYYPSFKIKIFTACLFFLGGGLSHIALDYSPKRLFRRKRRFRKRQ